MKIFKCFLLLVFMLPWLASAQDPDFVNNERFSLRGAIYSKENGEKLPFVHVINKTTGHGTHSDENGFFGIPTNLTDTIAISAVGYKALEFTLSDKDPALYKYRLNLYLDVSYVELSTVEIYPFKDEAAFKQDILKLQLPEQDKFAISLPKGQKPHSDNLAPSYTIGGPISAIQNIFSREAKELKKYDKAIKDEPNQQIIRRKFNREIVSEISGLKEEELNSFILFCSLSDDFILKSSEYEISEKIRACLKDFKNQEQN